MPSGVGFLLGGDAVTPLSTSDPSPRRKSKISQIGGVGALRGDLLGGVAWGALGLFKAGISEADEACSSCHGGRAPRERKSEIERARARPQAVSEQAYDQCRLDASAAKESCAGEKKKPTDAASGSGSNSPGRAPSLRPSMSPIRRGRSQHHGRKLVVRERVAQEVTGGLQWPTLTRTNYADWSVIMRVQLQVHGLWEAVSEGDVDDHEDRAVLAALLHAVPPELVRTLTAKDNAKAVWDTLKTLHVRAERVCDARAQTRRRDYDRLTFKDGETVEDFALHLSTILSDLEMLGDPEDEGKAVRKFLRVLPHNYRHMALSIESLLDIKTMSMEELCGRLLVVEENKAIDGAEDSGRRLLLTKEWCTCHKRAVHDCSSNMVIPVRPRTTARNAMTNDRPGRDTKPPAGRRRTTSAAIAGKKAIGLASAGRRNARRRLTLPSGRTTPILPFSSASSSSTRPPHPRRRLPHQGSLNTHS
ncbi:hypothetical protein QYE76_068229 [Lolium multiflorum]|uniref:DUF4219 domain-containing protein n=1 Tax=Lolium multiflorum TaxID=4521 RepID=A0AAD8SEW2_LOLMU|nr:hypothetical protein QYE76_068229 [Lolium multiflorum]